MSSALSRARAALEARRDALRLDAAPHGLLTLAAMLALSAALLAGMSGYHAGFLRMNHALAFVPAPLLEWLTYLGDSRCAILLLLPFARRYPQLIWAAVIAAILATLLSQMPKIGLDLSRPPRVLDVGSFRLIGPPYPTRSFPSGHTVTAFVTMGVLILSLPLRGLAAAALLVLAAAIGASRIAVGVHWPVDVLAGAALGLLCAIAGVWLARRWQAGLQFWAYHTLVAALTSAALGAFFVRIPYPQATPMLWGLALIALGFVVRDFIIHPLIRPAPRTP